MLFAISISLLDNDAEAKIPYRRLLLESIIARLLTPEESLAIFHALPLSSGMSSRSAQSEPLQHFTLMLQSKGKDRRLAHLP